MKKWKCTYLKINWKPKCSMQLLAVKISLHVSQNHALAHAHNLYQLCYLSNNANGVKSRILWYGNPNYGQSAYKFAIIEETEDDVTINAGIDIACQHTKRQLKYLMQEMRDDWFDRSTARRNKKYQDHSIELSDLAWRMTIPEGWHLVREGTVIKQSDLQFSENTYNPRFWGSVSWYNIGKKVGKSSGIGFADETGKIYKTIPAHIDPLIIRRNKTT